MSYTIIAQFTQEMAEYYQFLIEGHFDFKTLVAKDATDALNIIKQKGIPQLFICGAKSNGFLSFLDYYNSLEVRFPLIVTCKKFEEHLVLSKFKPQALSRLIHEDAPVDSLFEPIQKLILIGDRKSQQQVYCKVNIDFFKEAEELFCDVFVKLSDDKYVRIIDRYQPIASDLIERYMARNVRHLFVKLSDFKLLTNQLMKKLIPHTDQDKALTNLEKSRALISTSPSTLVFPIQLQETVYESISKIGLNEKSVEMASMAISNTMEIIEKNSFVLEHIAKYLKKGDYLSSHSFFLSYLSCAILRETAWKNPTASMKLTLAAFFHDIGLEDSEIAQLHDLEKIDPGEIDYRVLNKIKDHTYNSVKLMTKIEGIPADVDKIILQHHENYAGTGFPRGIDYKHFTPLSAIFKVAHEISDRLYIQGMDQMIVMSAIEEMKSTYKASPFNAIVTALEKCFPKKNKMAS
ncbi:MAG: hypothetical protein OHK0056_23430 [Bacteriovoracaceae bacterium]